MFYTYFTYTLTNLPKYFIEMYFYLLISKINMCAKSAKLYEYLIIIIITVAY